MREDKDATVWTKASQDYNNNNNKEQVCEDRGNERAECKVKRRSELHQEGSSPPTSTTKPCIQKAKGCTHRVLSKLVEFKKSSNSLGVEAEDVLLMWAESLTGVTDSTRLSYTKTGAAALRRWVPLAVLNRVDLYSAALVQTGATQPTEQAPLAGHRSPCCVSGTAASTCSNGGLPSAPGVQGGRHSTAVQPVCARVRGRGADRDCLAGDREEQPKRREAEEDVGGSDGVQRGNREMVGQQRRGPRSTLSRGGPQRGEDRRKLEYDAYL